MEHTKFTGKIETIISAAILALLAAVSATVFYQQFRFNPAVLTATEQGRVASTREPTGDGPPETSIVPLPDAVAPLSAPERFDPATLSDKIDGKAELYLSAGFRRLETQRFRARDAGGGWMELFLYDMGSRENAFAVYSSQQREDAQPLDVSRDSYRTENALYWVHGPYYAELIASESSEPVRQAMQAIAVSMVAGQEVENPVADLSSIFPEPQLRDNGITLIPSDAFGFSKLKRVYTAEYELARGDFTAFLSDQGTADSAAAAAEAYRQFLLEFGGQALESPALPETASEVMVVEILGSYEIIFSRGRFLAGVHEAPETAPAIALATALRQRIDEYIQSQSP